MMRASFGVIREYGRRNRALIIIGIVLAVVIVAGIRLHWKKEVIAAVAVLFALVTHLFGLVLGTVGGWIAAIPVMGPMIVKVVSWPLFLLINGLAFFTSLVGVNIGKGRQVFEARVAATILAAGVLIGFILGKMF